MVDRSAGYRASVVRQPRARSRALRAPMLSGRP